MVVTQSTTIATVGNIIEATSTQTERSLIISSRTGMTQEKFNQIHSRQSKLNGFIRILNTPIESVAVNGC